MAAFKVLPERIPTIFFFTNNWLFVSKCTFDIYKFQLICQYCQYCNTIVIFTTATFIAVTNVKFYLEISLKGFTQKYFP